MKALQIDGHTWHPASKLAIWRTFARPILEYCLPIVVTWLKQNKEKSIIQELEIRHKEALQWTCHSRSNCKVIERLTGVGSLKHRWECLKSRFAQHLQNVSISNPVNRLLQTSHTGPDDVTIPCSKHKFYNEWKNLPKEIKALFPSLPDFLKQKRVKHLQADYKGPLVAYMTDPSSFRLYDISLRCPDQRAVSWRLNKLFFGKKCPRCNERFHRGHLKTCSLLQDNPYYFTSSNEISFTKDRQKVMDKLKTNETNYNSIDYFISNYEYDKFTKVINDLSNSLISEAN
jgi:hypothetical protein